MAELENPPLMAVSSASKETLPKRKRNLPGMPDPNADVIALSPKTLMAKNRFVCEICSKGFQRDQNLQLHRRGHNLPWKLRQRTSDEPIRKRVYVCPETSCIHHNPERALGDLTGIKKHFCRKHGEKNWQCERCSKKYAVQSDWKAHMKVCGTKEYRCDCGNLFSQRDSFITHRAFCDVLAEENAGSCKTMSFGRVASPPPPPPHTPSATVVSPVLSIQSSELPENPVELLSPAAAVANSRNTNVFASVFASSSVMEIAPPPSQTAPSSFSCSIPEPTSLSLYLSSDSGSFFLSPDQDRRHDIRAPSATMSATALLQKAAQMGASATTPFLRSIGCQQDNAAAATSGSTTATTTQCQLASGLGLGLPSGGNYGLTDLMIGSSSMFGNKPTTLDLFGLGVDGDGSSSSGLSALLASFGGGGASPYCRGESSNSRR